MYNSKTPLVVTFFSEARADSDVYAKEAARFNEQMTELHSHPMTAEFDFVIDKIEGFRNYYRNARFKPTYIYYQMVKYNRPILWLDVDTVIKNFIPFQDFVDQDFAGVKHGMPEISLAIYAHCLWFNNTTKGKNILKEWAYICSKELDTKELHVKQIGDHSELCHNVLPKHYENRKDIPLIPGDFCDYKITAKSQKKDFVDDENE